MKLRGILFSTMLLSLPIQAEQGAFSRLLNSAIPESSTKSSITFDGKKIVDAEIVAIGKTRTLRLTYRDGAQQLLVENAAGQFVPVHKTRRKLLRGLVSITKYASILAAGALGGAYGLYHYGHDTEDGKRIIPTVATLLRTLIDTLPGKTDHAHSGSDTD